MSIDSMIASRSGITKITRLYTLGQINKMINDKSIISASWNRAEVKRHVGNAESLMESIVCGRSVNMFLGFWNGIATTASEINPTNESPLKITEGGHRLRWLTLILDNKAVVCGKTLGEIQIENVSLYDYIMSYQITMEIKTHVSGIVPEKYMKEEYRAVNTGGTNLSAGEIARASTDENSIELSEKMNTYFNHRADKIKVQDKNRDKGTATINALLRSMSMNDFSLMKSTLKDLPSIDDPTFDKINSLIVSLGELEKSILLSTTNSKVKKAMSSAICAKLHGTFFYALCNDTTPPTALNTIRRFFEISIVDEGKYKENIKEVTTNSSGGNGGSRLNTDFYEKSWIRLRGIVYPLRAQTTPLGTPTDL